MPPFYLSPLTRPGEGTFFLREMGSELLIGARTGGLARGAEIQATGVGHRDSLRETNTIGGIGGNWKYYLLATDRQTIELFGWSLLVRGLWFLYCPLNPTILG